jgi:tyrosyl-tRNA synthetase
MSIPDEQIVPYFRLATDLPLEELAGVERALSAGENPMVHKKALAERIVAMYHGAQAGQAARASFESQFVKRGRPLEAVLWTLPVAASWPLRQMLVDTGLAKTLSDARRKIEEGAVELEGAVVKDPRTEIAPPRGDKALALRLGRRWVQVAAGPEGSAPSASDAPVPLAAS